MHVSVMPTCKLLEGPERCLVPDGESAVTNPALNVFFSDQAGSRPNHPSTQELGQGDCELQSCVALYYRARHEKEKHMNPFFSDAVMKHCDQKQLGKERIYLGLRFQR